MPLPGDLDIGRSWRTCTAITSYAAGSADYVMAVLADWSGHTNFGHSVLTLCSSILGPLHHTLGAA